MPKSNGNGIESSIVTRATNQPDQRDKQRAFYEEGCDKKTIARVGEALFACGNFSEATICFARLKDNAKLQQIAELAMQQGDTFLFEKAKLGLEQKPSRDEYEQLAKTADSLGKTRFAEMARENAQLNN